MELKIYVEGDLTIIEFDGQRIATSEFHVLGDEISVNFPFFETMYSDEIIAAFELYHQLSHGVETGKGLR
jgi:hypothetical protein